MCLDKLETDKRSDEKATQKPLTFPYTSVPIPQPAAGVLQAISDRWNGLSLHLKRTLPSVVINNSSNVVGLEQLVAEALLFKSNGFDLWDKKNKGKPLYFIDPIFNIPKAAFAKFKPGSGPKFEWLKPSSYLDTARGFVDLERATLRDNMGGTRLLTNNLSALAGLTGMSAMAVAAVMPDKKESEEETERMAIMARENTLGYVGHRLLQAVNPLAWWDNKRQFSGLGMMATGTLSFLSAFRQVEGSVVGKQIYRHNVWHMVGGLITALSGTQLMLAINNQQGWSNYGSTQLARVVTLPASIGSRFSTGKTGQKESGALWYFGGQAMMVAKNATASLIGGGHRGEHGALIDHDAMREEAKEKARRHDAHDRPDTKVRQVMQREMALGDAELALQ